LSAVLDRLKLRLVQATSGVRALALAEDEEFAAIILDVQMPVLDGFETARLLRMRPGHQTPIIFLTANSHDPATSLRGYAEGAVDFLVKPFDPGILRSKVSVFVSLYEARRTVQRQEALLREHALEAQRRESDARYHSLAEAVPLIVWSSDVSGKITYANRTWTEYIGVAPQQLASWKHIIHPDDHPAVKLARDKARSNEDVFHGLWRLRSVSGLYRWHVVKAIPSRDAQGRMVGWLGTATDVDDQQRSEERSRFLAEASGALGASLDLREVLAQVCALAVPTVGELCAVHLRGVDGLSREVAVAPGLLDALASPGPEQLERLGIAEVLTSGRTVVERQASESSTPLGLSRWISVPLVSRGAVIGVLTLGRRAGADSGLFSEELVLELARRVALAADNARLYEEAQEAIRLRDEFLSVASHELRTPLTPLNLKLGMLRRVAEQAGTATLPAGQVAADIGVAARHVQRLTNLVDHLLDVTRIRAGKLQLQLEVVDAAEVVRDAATRLSAMAIETGSVLEVETPERCPGVWDRMRLEQIVTNLLSNALKYGGGQPVRMRLEEQGPASVVLSVRDAGTGMDPGVLGRIFGRFERGHSGRHYPGLGLGLYITRQIVTALEGTISVESTPGQGSLFTVVLPRTRAELEPDAAALGELPPRQGARGV
ncbi:MAG TPA: ATP-binding protein, partial [Myxococcaceae bacterium]|nr:ATP-binding protein [Myxococcaceae bacterium]